MTTGVMSLTSQNKNNTHTCVDQKGDVPEQTKNKSRTKPALTHPAKSTSCLFNVTKRANNRRKTLRRRVVCSPRRQGDE